LEWFVIKQTNLMDMEEPSMQVKNVLLMGNSNKGNLLE
jgi:hypothetical protein